jgi:hypothetical protein
MVAPLTFSSRPLTAADFQNSQKYGVVLSSQPGVWGSAELQQRSAADFGSSSIASETGSGNGGEISPLPARAGFSTANLSAGIANPFANTFSTGKTLGEVATAVRNALNQKYAAINASGSPFSKNSSTDWNTAFGDFDNTALNAVARNWGGHFSKDEQKAAQSLLDQSQRVAKYA